MKKYLVILLLLLLLTGCQEKTYTVTFNTVGGSILSNQKVIAGNVIESIDPPTKEGYIFVSWQKDGLEYDLDTPVNEDITLTATWVQIPELTPNQTVTFVIENITKTKNIESGKCVEKPIDPTKINYKFIGWYLENNLYDFSLPVEKDITLIAKFEKEILTITYDLNGGSGTLSTQIKKGETITKPTVPTRFGYHFVEWQYNNETYNFDTIPEKDITLKAIWEAIEYIKVTFDTDGGNTIKSQIIEKGTTIETPEIPAKEGYVFKYWAFEDTIFDLSTKLEKDITLKAIYEKNIDLNNET